MAVVKLRLYAQNAQLSFLIHNVVMLSPNFHGSHGKMLATPPTLVFFWSRGVKTISTGNECQADTSVCQRRENTAWKMALIQLARRKKKQQQQQHDYLENVDRTYQPHRPKQTNCIQQ